MDLQRMLEKCRRDQWSVDDLDWSIQPRALSKPDEMAIVQYFVDMAGIERLAKALFEVQRDRTEDPTLKAIFETFVVDEERHAVAAERLARHYDRHRYKTYALSPSLVRFRPHFLQAVRLVPASLANIYITGGELILDVALLRSIDDYVDDEMSKRAMYLINRDESRHIAIDYHMVEYYASDEYLRHLRSQPIRLMPLLRGLYATAGLMWYARPFAKEVFFAPMQVVDPAGKRIKEAFKRIQLLSRKPDVARQPFARFMSAVQLTYNTRAGRLLLGNVLTRIAGVPGEALAMLHDDDEARRAAGMTFEELAEEALGVKYGQAAFGGAPT
jgi:hypothetical protein